ncbi:hypothetical protein BDF22DRAFT_97841 [Syncephalis plumigaleata]|nr:hypothetical protein BDF22DRAFT_97841 [Syncephalis plumigaleata]
MSTPKATTPTTATATTTTMPAAPSTTSGHKRRSSSSLRQGSLGSEELKFKRKYRDLKKKVRTIEQESDKLVSKLRHLKRETNRLRIERSFLHEKLEQDGVFEEPLSSGSDDEEILMALATATGLTSGQHGNQSMMGPNGQGPYPGPNESYTDSMSQGGGGGRGGKRGSAVGGGSASGIGGSDKTPNRRGKRGNNADGTPTSRRGGGGGGGGGGGNANPFFAFCQKERAAVRAIMPDATNGEITRELGQRWRALTDEERQVSDLLAILYNNNSNNL